MDATMAGRAKAQIALLVVAGGLLPACGSSGTAACRLLGAECSKDSDCCEANLCVVGRCATCSDTGGVCDGASDCCGSTDACDGTGHCRACSQEQEACTTGVDCCPGMQCHGSRCLAPGGTCSTDEDCIYPEHCVQGSCKECTGDRYRYCEQFRGMCVTGDTVCSTITKCGDVLVSCWSGSLVVNCSTGDCECPADRPVWCQQAGSFDAGCWSSGTDCSTRTKCYDGDEWACRSGYMVDCYRDECAACLSPAKACSPSGTPCCPGAACIWDDYLGAICKAQSAECPSGCKSPSGSICCRPPYCSGDCVGSPCCS